VVACVVLPAFWLRDYMSLRMSPSYLATRRAAAYSITILVTSALIWALASKIGLLQLAKLAQSPPILVLVIGCQIAASVPSVWIKVTQSYNWMWATALLPAPILWFVLLQITLVCGYTFDAETARLLFFGVAILWAASMIIAIFRTRDIQMSVHDLDFAVLFGSVSQWLAICAVPLALSIA
jgi:hypothetical protein